MDDLFSQIECRSKFDSIVMRILRSAMDKAHEKLQSKDGPIEFLHQRSTFYELASILVEGGLGIVREEEMDILEGGHDKILSDLMEIRHWLQGRIQDMKHLIVDKDRELKERFENESRLKQLLEIKERELHEKLEPGMMKNEGLQDFPMTDQVLHTEGDISKLKSSVDQQVWNIKQKLEDEEKILSNETRKILSPVSSPDLSMEFIYSEINQNSSHGEENSSGLARFSKIRPKNELSDQNVLIRTMSSDINILKETLDQAFGKMQRAEVQPLEKQWRCGIEKDIESILVKGFITNLQQSFDTELRKKAGVLKDNWFDFIDEMRTLSHELKGVCSSSEKQINTQGKSSCTSEIWRTSSEPLQELDFMDKLDEDDVEADRSNFVAKMVKSHESVIHKQNKDWTWLTREVLQRDVQGFSSAVERAKENNRLERRIQEAITRLDNLIKRNHRFGERTSVSGRSKIQEKRKIPKSDTKAVKGSKGLEEENAKLTEERDRLFFQISLIEDTYQLLFQCMAKDLNERFCFQNIDTVKMNGQSEDSTSTQILLQYMESSIREDVYVVFVQEIFIEWKKGFEGNNLLGGKRTQILCDDHCHMVRGQEVIWDNFFMFPETIESLLQEDIYMVFFKEMAENLKSEREAYAIESLLWEDIYQFVVLEAVNESHTSFLRESEIAIKQLDFRDVTPRSRQLTKSDSFGEGTPRSRKLESDGGEESLTQKLDSLLRCLEAEEDLMLRVSSEIKEHSVSNSLVILNCEEMDERDAIEWLLTDDECLFSSVSEKLERALQQLYTSRELLVELSLEVSDDLEENDCEELLNNTRNIEYERLHSIEEENEASETALSGIVLTPLTEFEGRMEDFEQKVHRNLDDKSARLRVLKHDVDALFETLALLRARKLLYKKAFISRCHNLKLAESEVDLLGDQVESLLCLLERIYVELNQNATSSQNFRVSEISTLIRKELENAAICVES